MKLTRRNQILAAGAALVLAAGGLGWAYDSARWVSTDNAYVAADTARVTPQTEGFVQDVLVRENQFVSAGQPLVRLDPADARANLAAARAQLADRKSVV